jgi:hypothetical protein
MPINLAHLPAVTVRAADTRGLPDAAKSIENSCDPPQSEHKCTGQKRKSSPVHAANPPVAVIHADSDPHGQRSFPIDTALHPAASSFRGLSTWTVSSRRQVSRRGPHRKTFRKAD